MAKLFRKRKITCGLQQQLMEMILKLFTQLQNKLNQFIKDHIIDECPEDDSDLF